MTAVLQLMEQCRACGIRLQRTGDDLLIDAPKSVLTPEIVTELKNAKADVLTLLRADSEQLVTADDGQFVDWIECEEDGQFVLVRSDVADLEYIDIPDPCPRCSGIVVWEDFKGNLHCERCEPRTTGERLRRLAARLRG